MAWVLILNLTMVILPFQVAAYDKEEESGHHLEEIAEKGDGNSLEVVGELPYDIRASHHFITQGNIEDIAARIEARLVGEKPESVNASRTFQVEGEEGDEAIKTVPDRGGKARADFSILHGPLTTGKALTST